MREILFKGKTEDGKWIEGGYFKYHSLSGEEKPLILEETESGFRYTQVDPETVCQFTGKTDKNGVKMWENDIVKGLLLFGTGINGVVAFNDGSFGLKWHRGGAEMFTPFAELCNITYEVVGNIFDNPELMEGGVQE